MADLDPPALVAHDNRFVGLRDARPGLQQFHDAFHGAGRALYLAPYLAQRGKCAGRQDGVENELAELTGGRAALDDGVGAHPQAPDDRAEHEHDGDGCQQGPGPDPAQRGPERRLGGLVETPRFPALADVGLDDLDGAECLARQRTGVSYAVLAETREPADPPAEEYERQQDQRDHDSDHPGETGARDHEHGEPADQQQEVPQGDRCPGTDNGLQYGSVRRQPGEYLARPCALVEVGAQSKHVPEDFAADVGDDPLAEPGHHVVASRGGDGKDRRDAEQRVEVPIDRCLGLG
jgi:hypothetical protein